MINLLESKAVIVTGENKGIGFAIAELFAEEGGDVMLEFSDKNTNTTVPSVEHRDQAYAALYLASEMGKAATGQVIQVDNGGFL
ncbi:MAG: SDR family NAD(P)-dependent oxidoreductase [Gammaproteobacteria bacterium]|nr:SDR family NAD(P)-dependent oxidoreductase [Gammaproteobacteria bacterium]